MKSITLPLLLITISISVSAQYNHQTWAPSGRTTQATQYNRVPARAQYNNTRTYPTQQRTQYYNNSRSTQTQRPQTYNNARSAQPQRSQSYSTNRTTETTRSTSYSYNRVRYNSFNYRPVPRQRAYYYHAGPAIIPTVRLGAAVAIYSSALSAYSGIGNIYYVNGFYRGQIYHGRPNGTGTFYYSDGTFYRGAFTNGLRNGAGVLVTFQGYVSGCWSYGTYTGPCGYNYNNNYSNNNTSNNSDDYSYNDNTVSNTVSQVQTDLPKTDESNNKYNYYDPDNYNVTKIDASTPMGQQLLGAYN